jgi:SnoaL-like domain
MQEFVAEFWDPDADYYPVRKFPDAHARHGVREIAEFFGAFAESWETFEFVPVAIESAGDDRVLVRATINAVGRDTSLRLEGDIYHCVWLRQGRVLRWEDHLTEAGALDARR